MILWMGKDIDTMTRDEAMAALKMCIRRLSDTYADVLRTHEFYKLALRQPGDKT